MKIFLNKDNNTNFKAIKMKPKDMKASCEFLRSYASTDRAEFSQQAFEIFDKYIVKEAKSISEKRHTDYKTVYEYLCKVFWEKIDSLKFQCARAENYFKKLCFELKYDAPVTKTAKSAANQKSDKNINEVQKLEDITTEPLVAKEGEETVAEESNLSNCNDEPEVIALNEKILTKTEKLTDINPETNENKNEITLPEQNSCSLDEKSIPDAATNLLSKYKKRAADISLKNKKGTSYRQIARDEGISPTAVSRAALIHRNTMKLMHGDIPEEIREKAQDFISVFGLSGNISKIIKWLIANPTLITDDIKILENHVNSLSEMLNIDKTKLAASGIKSIVVYTAKPETTINNINNTLKAIKDIYGISVDRDIYIKSCLAQPSIFAYKPETIMSKIKTVENYLLDKNIKPDKEDFIYTCTRSLWLFSNSSKNAINKLNRLYADNPNADWAAVKNLLKEVVYMDNAKISDNITQVIKELEPFGLTRSDYENAIRKHKNIAKQNPQTIIKRVKDLSEIFILHGLTLNDCLRVCAKQPSLFFQSSDTIKEHIRAYLYVYKNKYNQSGKEALQNVLSNCLSYSTLKIYLNGIIYPQLKNSVEKLKSLKLTNLQSDIVNFFKGNPEKKCTIEIVDDEMKDHFIQLIDDFCLKNIGRKVFNYETIVPKDTIHIIRSAPKGPAKSTPKKASNFVTIPAESSKPMMHEQNTMPMSDVKRETAQPVLKLKENLLHDEQEYISAPMLISKPKPNELRMFLKDGVLPVQYEKKIKSFAESFGQEESISDLREAFIKHPELFSMKLSILVNNINLLAKNINLKSNELLIKCLLKNPTPFYHAPQKLEDNIKELLVEFKRYNLDIDKLLNLYISKSSLLSSGKLLLNNLRANIYASSFYNKENVANIDLFLNSSITMPEVNIYINKIVIPQVSDEIYLNTKLTAGNFVEFISAFLKQHPIKEFNIKVLNNQMSNRFIEVMNEFSQRYFNRIIFHYIKCSRNQLSAEGKK